MSGADGDRESAAFCADLVRSHDFARYASTLFVPSDQRRALLALYAFNVEISRVREQVSQPLPGEIRLQWWTDMLAGAGHGGVEGNPVAAELMLAIRSYRLPVERLSRLIDEHQFDLYNDPMPTMAALEGYINDTVVRAVFARRRDLWPSIRGDRASRAPCRPRAGHRAGDRGVAAGCRRGANCSCRCNCWSSHGSGMEEVFAGKQTPKLRAALDQLIAEAREHLKTAFALLASVPPEVRPVFLPLALVRRDLQADVARGQRSVHAACRVAACGHCGRCGGRQGRGSFVAVGSTRNVAVIRRVVVPAKAAYPVRRGLSIESQTSLEYWITRLRG